MQQMWKILSTLVDALEIGGGFTKPILPITEHVRNDVHFGIAIYIVALLLCLNENYIADHCQFFPMA